MVEATSVLNILGLVLAVLNGIVILLFFVFAVLLLALWLKTPAFTFLKSAFGKGSLMFMCYPDKVARFVQYNDEVPGTLQTKIDGDYTPTPNSFYTMEKFGKPVAVAYALTGVTMDPKDVVIIQKLKAAGFKTQEDAQNAHECLCNKLPKRNLGVIAKLRGEKNPTYCQCEALMVPKVNAIITKGPDGKDIETLEYVCSKCSHNSIRKCDIKIPLGPRVEIANFKELDGFLNEAQNPIEKAAGHERIRQDERMKLGGIPTAKIALIIAAAGGIAIVLIVLNYIFGSNPQAELASSVKQCLDAARIGIQAANQTAPRVI